jgi:hypothetical protein
MKAECAIILLLIAVLSLSCEPDSEAPVDDQRRMVPDLNVIRMNGGCTDQRFLNAEAAAFQALLRAREDAARILDEEITSIEKEYKKMLARINQDYVANLNACRNDQACTKAAKDDNDKYVNRVEIYHDEALYVAQGKDLSAKEQAQADYEAAVKDAREKFCRKEYRVSGEGGGLSYSGVICSLEKPFTVYGSAYNYNFKFTPSSESNGTWAINTSVGGGRINGSGAYTIEGLGSDKPKIKVAGKVNATVPYASGTGGGTHYFDLTPLDTDECSGK